MLNLTGPFEEETASQGLRSATLWPAMRPHSCWDSTSLHCVLPHNLLGQAEPSLYPPGLCSVSSILFSLALPPPQPHSELPLGSFGLWQGIPSSKSHLHCHSTRFQLDTKVPVIVGSSQVIPPQKSPPESPAQQDRLVTSG